MPYKEFEMCISPDLDLPIWRYMSLQKFELLLIDKSLFFCRADKFSDPFEGSIPKKEADYRMNTFGNNSTIELISKFHKKFKGHLIVNCWHINNAENDAMWQLYLKDNEGIAIKTTTRKLIESLKNTKEDIYCSMLRYIDYEKDIWVPPFDSYNMFVPIVHKRQEFKHENEVRLINVLEIVDDIDEFWKKQPKEKGKDIRINLNDLIEEIYTAPTSKETDLKKVEDIIDQHGYNFTVKKSKMDNEPYY